MKIWPQIFLNKPRVDEQFILYHGLPTTFVVGDEEVYYFSSGDIVYIENWEKYLRNGLIKRVK